MLDIRRQVQLLAVIRLSVSGLAAVEGAAMKYVEVNSMVPPSLDRWHTPCDGTNPVDGKFTILDPNASKRKKGAWRRPLKRDVIQLFEYANAVSKYANDFQKLYKNSRFIDETERKKLELSEYNVPGYSEVILQKHNFESLTTINQSVFVAWLQMSVKKFSWVAAYTRLAHIEESLDEKQYFNHYFERSEEQVYWILCILHRMLYHLKAPANNQLIYEDVVPREIKSKDDTVKRHRRNYVVLRDYSLYMNIFKREISGMAKLVGFKP